MAENNVQEDEACEDYPLLLVGDVATNNVHMLAITRWFFDYLAEFMEIEREDLPNLCLDTYNGRETQIAWIRRFARWFVARIAGGMPAPAVANAGTIIERNGHVYMHHIGLLTAWRETRLLAGGAIDIAGYSVDDDEREDERLLTVVEVEEEGRPRRYVEYSDGRRLYLGRGERRLSEYFSRFEQLNTALYNQDTSAEMITRPFHRLRPVWDGMALRRFHDDPIVNSANRVRRGAAALMNPNDARVVLNRGRWLAGEIDSYVNIFDGPNNVVGDPHDEDDGEESGG